MKTLKELKNFCEKNNIRYEIHTVYGQPYDSLEIVDGHYKFVEKRNIMGFTIGMNNIAGKKGQSEWQWTLFETIGCYDEPTDDTMFYFSHRYSMLNGKYHKGWREHWKALEIIEKRSA